MIATDADIAQYCQQLGIASPFWGLGYDSKYECATTALSWV
jgi:hypothetical protein